MRSDGFVPAPGHAAPRERTEFDCPICTFRDEVSVIRIGGVFWLVCERCRVKCVWLVGRAHYYPPQSRRQRRERRRILQRFTLLTSEM